MKIIMASNKVENIDECMYLTFFDDDLVDNFKSYMYGYCDIEVEKFSRVDNDNQAIICNSIIGIIVTIDISDYTKGYFIARYLGWLKEKDVIAVI